MPSEQLITVIADFNSIKNRANGAPIAAAGPPLGRPKGPRECEFASGKLINLLRFACS
jgi:hypothetical protein